MKLLLVEDLHNIRTALAMMLRLVFQNPHIDEASTSTQAIALLNKTHYDAVISDHNLGAGGFGTEVEEFIKKNYRKEKFILCSSLPPSSFCGQMLAKPFKLQDIRDLKDFIEKNEWSEK